MRTGLLAGMVVVLLAGTAEAQRCLHGPDEPASERARREEAIAFLRELHAAERRARSAGGEYVPLSDVGTAGRVPIGFVPRLTIDRFSYVVSLKDLFDPCGFALFSDQDGQIYGAVPIEAGGAAPPPPASPPPDDGSAAPVPEEDGDEAAAPARAGPPIDGQ